MRERDSQSTYYEVLEIAADATQEQIDAAYERLTSYLSTESLVMYSIVDDDEATTQRQTIDKAYQTLSDPRQRAAYDRQRGAPAAHEFGGPLLPEREGAAGTWSVGGVERAKLPPPAVVSRTPARVEQESPRPTEQPNVAKVAPARRLRPTIDVELNDDTEFSGGLLRRLRESAGATIDDLAELTKVNRRYVRAIEDHDFENLPAKVYVRGFVSEYARALGLDGQRVATSYMTVYRRYREGTGER